MGIFSRITDIINSNINSMLDNAEDPSKMIRLIIQEMEETLVEVRSSSARIIADKKEVGRKHSRLQAQANEWESKAALALSKDREDLARAALAEKSSLEEEAIQTESELTSIEGHLAALNDEVTQLQIKLDDAKSKQKTLLLRAKTAESRYKVKQQIHRGAIDKAFNKMELFERRMDELEGHLESYDLGKKDLADEFKDLEKNDKINDELARLKEKMKPRA
ncbi:MAG: phage shock protein PspA [Alteromonadaceae bacterium]|nr:MAG: phage shock protein PspA [Alteromonadaceae bacterium]